MKGKCLFKEDNKMTVSLLRSSIDVFTCKRCGYDFSLNEVSTYSQLEDIEMRRLKTSSELVGHRDEVHYRLNSLNEGLFNF